MTNRKNRKDLEFEISYEKAEKLYKDLVELSGNDLAGFVFEGCLLDEYAIVMAGNQNWQIPLKKGRPILARKYGITPTCVGNTKLPPIQKCIF